MTAWSRLPFFAFWGRPFTMTFGSFRVISPVDQLADHLGRRLDLLEVHLMATAAPVNQAAPE